MPELPEVEVTRRRIAPHLIGRRLAQVHTTADSYFFVTPPAKLKRALKGRTITELTRRGKYMVAALDNDASLLLHLGMTGQLFVRGSFSLRLLSSTSRATLPPERQVAFEPDKHTHMRFVFEDGEPEVLFRDTRKFGKVEWIAPGASNKRLDKLGIDGLDATGPVLFDASRKRRVAAKLLLLDQSVLAGVGNIYADEALFLTGVRPQRKAARLTKAECSKLADSLRAVMERSIETGGSSISDYVAPDGSDGGYQDERHVYAREGEPCRRCATPIKRLVLGQRSSHYCPRCQK